MVSYSSTAEIIPFNRPAEPSTYSSENPATLRATPTITNVDDGSATRERQTGVLDLYGDADAPSARVVLLARTLLQSLNSHISDAGNAFDHGDEVAADLETMKAFALLPEIFCCRELSKGFGSVSLGIYYAFINRRGEALERSQLSMLKECVVYISENPFIDFENALDWLDRLEESGLSINPPEADALGEILA
jgi:hypothetical protein